MTGTFELALFSNGEAIEQFWNEVIEGFKSEYPKLEVKSIISGSIGDEIRPRWIKNEPLDICYLQGASVGNDMVQLFKEKRFENCQQVFSCT